MSNINAQTIINEVLAAHAIAPDECTPNAFVKFQTSARGSHRILNCKENLQRFADLVRKNAAAFGGGLIREEKQKPAIVWPSKSIALFKQCIEDNDYQAAFDIGTGKLGALFFVDNKGRACMQVAPIPLDCEPRLVSMLNENGKWSVCCPVSMLGLDSLTGNKRNRQAQIDAAAQHLHVMKPEKLEAMMANAHAKPVDQSATRAKWLADHGIVDDAAIEARIEANAAQDVAQIVAQAVAVSAIADAMAHEAEDAQELVTCEAESEAQSASTGKTDDIVVYPSYMVALGLAPACGYTSTPTPAVSSETVTPPVAITEYRYAMVNRPFSIGTAPKDGFIRMDARPENDEPHHAMARHGIAVYDRQLTDKETLDYEMAPIADDAMLADICANVCADMIEYADGYIEMASSTWLDFQSHVTQALNRITKSYRVSLCTYELSQMVVNALTCQQEKCKALPTTVAVSGEPPTPRPTESTNFAADIPLSLAVSAFGGVSMSPERRGASAQAGYAQDMAQDYETMRIQAVKCGTLDLLPEVFARYRGRQAGAYRAYLASSSRCVSSFIAGPSNFPAARMNKRNDIAHRRLTEYLDGGKMAMQAAIRTLRPDLRAIMAGDADAIDRLAVKIANAERSQERMKEANKAIRTHAKSGHAHQVEALMALGFTETQSIELIKPDFCGRIGFANYQLTNNNANIRRMKDRLESISKAQATEVHAVECSNGITLEDDAPSNRVRLYFPGKPDEAIRTELKANGFRWAPSIGAWQAYRNRHTLTTAKRLAGEPAPAEDVPEVAEVAPIEAMAPVVESVEVSAPPVAEVETEHLPDAPTTPAAEIQPEPVANVVAIATTLQELLNGNDFEPLAFALNNRGYKFQEEFEKVTGIEVGCKIKSREQAAMRYMGEKKASSNVAIIQQPEPVVPVAGTEYIDAALKFAMSRRFLPDARIDGFLTEADISTTSYGHVHGSEVFENNAFIRIECVGFDNRNGYDIIRASNGKAYVIVTYLDNETEVRKCKWLREHIRVNPAYYIKRMAQTWGTPDTTPDDHAKFNIRAKSGAWFACVYMVGAMYGLRFEAICGPQGCTTYATHAERMQALEAMARATTPPDTPPDGGLPIATDDAPTDAPTPPVAECTPDTPVAVSRAKPEHDLQVGDVVRSSWGYDQTNVNYYQVIALIGKRTVEVRELAEHKESTGDMTGRVAPVWGEFIGEAMRRTVDRHGTWR